MFHRKLYRQIVTHYRPITLSAGDLASHGLVTRHEQLIKTIIDNTKISKDHLTPEISLRLITKECKLFHEPITDASQPVFESDPFWAFYWPGGQALSRYILDNPGVVRSKSVLDVGSGSGACAIAAVMCDARYAVANDIDAVASIAAHINAELNNILLSTCEDNLIGQKCDEDIIFLGDVFYDDSIAEIIIPWLETLKKAGKEILIGDPGRHGLTEERLRLLDKLASYELTENCCIENNGFKFVNVWKFK